MDSTIRTTDLKTYKRCFCHIKFNVEVNLTQQQLTKINENKVTKYSAAYKACYHLFAIKQDELR